MEKSEQNFYVDTPWTWRERLRWKLFPARHCELPEAPVSYKDVIHVKTVVVFGWLDRLRVLVSGCLVVDHRVVTENIAGHTATSSVAYPALRWWK